jgi:hypothetical protein
VVDLMKTVMNCSCGSIGRRTPYRVARPRYHGRSEGKTRRHPDRGSHARCSTTHPSRRC